jgi:prophage maintenance system killer protein
VARHVSPAEVLLDYLAVIGRPGCVDLDMLESIVLRATAVDTGDDTIHHAAAALLEGLVRRNAFIDGNKDVALRVVRRFYTVNDRSVDHVDGQLVPLIADVARGQVTLEESARQLRALIDRARRP